MLRAGLHKLAEPSTGETAKIRPWRLGEDVHRHHSSVMIHQWWMMMMNVLPKSPRARRPWHGRLLAGSSCLSGRRLGQFVQLWLRGWKWHQKIARSVSQPFMPVSTRCLRVFFSKRVFHRLGRIRSPSLYSDYCSACFIDSTASYKRLLGDLEFKKGLLGLRPRS